MSSDYNHFVNRYGVKHLRAVTGGYDKFQPFYAGNTATLYNNNREELIEMEIPRNSFEELIHVHRIFDDMDTKYRKEVHMRRKYPAIAEAYDKYRMLLELYR